MTKDVFVEKVTAAAAGLKGLSHEVPHIVERLMRSGIWIEDKAYRTWSENPVVALVMAKARRPLLDQAKVDEAWEFFKTRDRRWQGTDRRRTNVL